MVINICRSRHLFSFFFKVLINIFKLFSIIELLWLEQTTIVSEAIIEKIFDGSQK